MSITIRGEMCGDEDQIDVVVCRAFGRMSEAWLVREMRQSHPAFDARFSVTAWEGDRLVGHTLFTPAKIRLVGETIPALAVAPVAVVPDRQRQGIGGELLRYAHELGRNEGFRLAFLCGHPFYYPRHGYRVCHGFPKIAINKETLPQPTQKVEPWPVRESDLSWIAAASAAEWNGIDFSWEHGANGAEWTIPGIDTVMWWTEDGRRAAYTIRWQRGMSVLGDDAALVRDVILTAKPETLLHHPSGWLARNALDSAWATITPVETSIAAMACELEPGVLGPYLAAVESGARPVGACDWILPFALCC